MVVNELAEVTRTTDVQSRSEFRANGVALLLLALAIAGVFGRARGERFVDWDDRINVSLNPDLNPPTLATVAKYWRSPQLGMYIPVVYSAWAGLAKIPHLRIVTADGSTLDPSIFHSANLVGHLLCSFVVWHILRRLLPASPGRDWAAGAGALLFALHPLQVEPVAWITGFKDVLSGLFAMTALWLYIIGLWKSDAGIRVQQWIYFSLATVSYGLALLSKPSATCVPLMAIVIDCFFFHRYWKKWLPLIALWCVMAISMVVVTQSSQLDRLMFRPSWDLRPFVALDAIGFYLGKLFLPIRLGIDYGRAPLPLVESGTLQWSWIPGLVFCVAIWLGRRRFPGARVPALLFLAGIAPVLGLAPFLFQNMSTVADRFVCVAMLGPALGLAQLIICYPYARIWAVSGIVLALFAFLSFVQVGVWHDDLSLITHALKVNPGSQVMTEKLGTAVSNTGDLDRGDALYRQSLAMRWNDVGAMIGLGSNMHKRGRLHEAATYLQRAALIEPTDADATFNYGNVLFDEHKLDEAIRQYEWALDARPGDTRVLVNLGTALAMSGSWSESENVFRAAVKAAPQSAMAHAGLGRVLEQRGDFADAMAEYQTALEYQPELAAALRGKARILQMLRR
jgi:Flp pilus assembly protein TadD